MIYLASTSPRRFALLTQAGIPFIPITPGVEESLLPEESPEHYVRRLAHAKAAAAAMQRELRALAPYAVLGADTVVILDNTVLHKPIDFSEAQGLLQQLSGRTHAVLTALCLYRPDHSCREVVSRTEVTFKNLSPHEICAYCATDEPFGKAGGYAIQGRAGIFVSKLVGSYSGVVGLPLYECTQLLKAEDWV